MNDLNAIRITGQTSVGTFGPYPRQRGNCFSIEDETEEHYRIVNFVLENLEHLVKKGLTWPVKCEAIRREETGEWLAVINDARIGDRWYADHFCEICCPASLLPLPQLLKQRREEQLGNRQTVGNRMVSVVLGSGRAKPQFE